MYTRPIIIVAQIVNGTLGRNTMDGFSPGYGSGDGTSSFATCPTVPLSLSPSVAPWLGRTKHQRVGAYTIGLMTARSDTLPA